MGENTEQRKRKVITIATPKWDKNDIGEAAAGSMMSFGFIFPKDILKIGIFLEDDLIEHLGSKGAPALEVEIEEGRLVCTRRKRFHDDCFYQVVYAHKNRQFNDEMFSNLWKQAEKDPIDIPILYVGPIDL